jgi:FAD/FMN-containing dehydrogenase
MIFYNLVCCDKVNKLIRAITPFFTCKSFKMKRRESLKLMNTLILGSFAKNWMKDEKWTYRVNDIAAFAKSNDIECIIDRLGMRKYAKDFGNIYENPPQAVLLPDSLEKVKAILSFVNQKNLVIVARGAGHSQSGQSLPVKNGLTIDLSKFNKIGKIERGPDNIMTISCNPGSTLRQLNEIATNSGYMLPALPFYLELTIGGVLSAGGIGSASHQHGLLVSNVTELEVLKADGAIVTCTSTVNQEVFNSVLGTSGRFGIITKARLKLIESKKIFRTLRLIYKNIDQWLSDYHFLLIKDISNLQGICVRSKDDPAIWNFMLEVSLQGDTEEGLSQYNDIISKLTFNAQLKSSDYTPIEFLDRYKDRFEQMRQQGRFAQYHPILEFIISADKAKEIVEKALQTLPPAYEDGFRLIYINKKNLPPYVMVPEAEQLCMFAVLPTGIAQQHKEECFNAAKTLHEYAMTIDAKRYLSGWVGMMDQQEFKNHYGGKAAKLSALKKNMDPGNVFKSLFAEKFYGWS